MANDRNPNRRRPASRPPHAQHRGGRPAPNQPNRPPNRTELQMAAPEPEPKGLMYIAYAERGDDVAFEVSSDIEEALGVYQIMKEDGFEPRLYQATEIDVVEDPE